MLLLQIRLRLAKVLIKQMCHVFIIEEQTQILLQILMHGLMVGIMPELGNQEMVKVVYGVLLFNLLTFRLL